MIDDRLMENSPICDEIRYNLMDEATTLVSKQGSLITIEARDHCEGLHVLQAGGGCPLGGGSGKE